MNTDRYILGTAALGGVYGPVDRDVSVNTILRALELGLPGVDVLFLHDPWMVPLKEVDAVIEQLQLFKQKGYTRRIGLGGNPPDSFARHIGDGVFDVVMEFTRLTAICGDALSDTLPKYHTLGIQPFVASVLHFGLLGRRFDEFMTSPPAWVDPVSMQRAAALKAVADEHRLSLSAVAQRYVFHIPIDIKIVTGPSNLLDLEETWKDILSGPLPAEIIHEIRLIQQKNVS